MKRGHKNGVTPFITWIVLLAVLAGIASGRFRIEIVALAGLLLLGAAGAAPAGIIFSGFGHPALATIVAVFFMSQGIVNSGMMLGLGQALARRVHSPKGQILGIALAGALLSSFMNNVGAVGLMLPTAVRMAKRAGVQPGRYGLPLSMASILGGTLTLIGSAPNIIIASYMLSTSGVPFRMFDFAPHGLAMLLAALPVWLIYMGQLKAPEGKGGTREMEAAAGEAPDAKGGTREMEATAGEAPDAKGGTREMEATIGEVPQRGDGHHGGEGPHPGEAIPFAPLATRDRRITCGAILLAVTLVSTGLLHPALGFGGAVLFMVFFRILRIPAAYESIDLKIVLFLGAMLGMGQTLEYAGSLDLLSAHLGGVARGLSPFPLIVMLIFVSSALSNAINNAAAAVFMAPLAAGMAGGGSLEMGAALMAVAAGSNMTLLLPTHQAALMVMSKAPFPTSSFMKAGWAMTLICGLAAAGVITLVWQ